MADPTFDEVKSTIEEVNTGKAPGLDGIPVELLRCGGDNIATAVKLLSVYGMVILFLRTGWTQLCCLFIKARVPRQTVVTTEA